MDAFCSGVQAACFVFEVPFPFALTNAAASVIGYVLVRAIYRLVRG